ncbi:MAG: T9SS type A sorting domain-containing protein [Bacteroidetes bacterium]|nr:T9SS type A sorting domain-containing protein [Bacteroidota bacterium]
MKKLILILFCFLLTNKLLLAQQTTLNKMKRDSIVRGYIVYVPKIYNDSIAVPLLFNFHGSGGTVYDLENNKIEADYNWLSMRTIADTAGFILVYPQASTAPDGGKYWRFGFNSAVDDIGFTAAMIDTISNKYKIDLNRVYSCGYSNGGFFSVTLACFMSDKIAAIGCVAGFQTVNNEGYCNPVHPTPVVTIHGTADNVISYYGNKTNGLQSQQDLINYWTDFNNTSKSPVKSRFPKSDSKVERSIYDKGDSCVSVEHYRVIGGGHDWFGNWGNMDINSGKVIWDFVSRYSIKGLIGCATLSSNEIKNNNMIAYPNPLGNELTVDLGSEMSKKIVLYDAYGKLVLSVILNSQKNIVDVSFLTPGMYVLHTETQTLKLIKI